MSGPRYLRAVPDPRDGVVLDWLQEHEVVDAAPVLDAVFETLADIRQVRRWPWDAAVEVLRPIDRQTRARRWAVVVAAALVERRCSWLRRCSGALFARRDDRRAAGAHVGRRTERDRGAVGARGAGLPAREPSPRDRGRWSGREPVSRLDRWHAARRIPPDIATADVQPAWAPDGKRILVLDQQVDTEQQWEIDPNRCRAEPGRVAVHHAVRFAERSVVLARRHEDTSSSRPEERRSADPARLRDLPLRPSDPDAASPSTGSPVASKRIASPGSRPTARRSRSGAAGTRCRGRRRRSTTRRSSSGTSRPARSDRSPTGPSTRPRSTGRPMADGSPSPRSGGATPTAATRRTSGASTRTERVWSSSRTSGTRSPGSRATRPTVSAVLFLAGRRRPLAAVGRPGRWRPGRRGAAGRRRHLPVRRAAGRDPRPGPSGERHALAGLDAAHPPARTPASASAR